MPTAITDAPSETVPPKPEIDHDQVIVCDNQTCPGQHLLKDGILVAVVCSGDQIVSDIPPDPEKVPWQLCVYGLRYDVTMQVCKSCAARQLAGLRKPPGERQDFAWLVEGDIIVIVKGDIVEIETVEINPSDCSHCSRANT